MRLINLLYPALALLPHALAQAQIWGQCGGIGWVGSTTCTPGGVCVVYNPYYSQCVPESQASVSTTPTPTVQPTTTTTTTVSVSGSCAISYPRATGPPIVALDGWAAGSYLQGAQGSNAAILGPSSSRAWFFPGASIRMLSFSSPNCIRYLYFNIKAADTSYKPLAFESVGTTSDWKYDGPNGTISTGAGSSTFITCSGGPLYIQTGSDFPSGNCTTTRLKVAQY